MEGIFRKQKKRKRNGEDKINREREEEIKRGKGKERTLGEREIKCILWIPNVFFITSSLHAQYI